MTSITSIEFEGHGAVRLRGELLTPDEEGPFPGVVMAHGFSAVRTMALPDYAAALAGAGFAVLLYDHRNLGDSDGEPRQEINPWAQARDYRYAIDWMSHRSEVDPERIAVWGSSFSGGEVLAVGAIDDRVRAVVANVPFAGLPGQDYEHTDARFDAMKAMLLDSTDTGLADSAGSMIGPLAVVDDETTELDIFLPQPEAAEWFLDAGQGGTWRNEVTLRNAFGSDPTFDPGVCIDQLAPTPLLMVVASDDRVADTAIAVAAFERAGQPKQLVMVDGHHFAPYSGPALEQATTATVDFLRGHLLTD